MVVNYRQVLKHEGATAETVAPLKAIVFAELF
jgi:hypothetical protein